MLTALLALAQVTAPPRFEAAPCPQKMAARAICGTVRVPENRANPAGRRIALNVVVLKPKGPAHLPPLFDIDGGPGLPSTKNVGFYEGNDVSNDRDVVMVDQRGTGGSNGLFCPDLSAVP